MAILEGRLEAPGFDNPEWRAAYLEAEWRGPKKGSINPANDRAADKIALDYKLTTRRDILNEENLDVRDVVSQLSDEYRMGEEQDPPVVFPDAQPKPTISPNEPRPGAQDDRQKKGLSLAANVGELLDRIEKLERANVALAAGWDESKHPRVPAGQAGGGQFGEGGKGATEKSKEAHGVSAKARKESAGGDDKAAGEAPGAANDTLESKAAAAIGKREWWHVPPEDKSAYTKRGKFYSSSFEEAEFYGIRSDAKPERVEVDRPLVGDELHIEKTLLGRHASADLPDPGDKEFYKARTDLDHELATEARRAGYDAIALLTPKGFAAFQKTGRLPKSVELNTLSDVGAAAGHVEALPLPPKDAPEELKKLYRERQRAYTAARKPGISDDERKSHEEHVADLKAQIDKARKDHPEWFAKGPDQGKPPADSPGAPPAKSSGSEDREEPETAVQGTPGREPSLHAPRPRGQPGREARGLRQQDLFRDGRPGGRGLDRDSLPIRERLQAAVRAIPVAEVGGVRCRNACLQGQGRQATFRRRGPVRPVEQPHHRSGGLPQPSAVRQPARRQVGR